MNTTTMMPRRALWTSLTLGAVVGTAVLGVGGRLAMRAFALLEGQNPGFTLGGSMAVVLLGAAAGVAGGLLLWLGRKVFPSRPIARGLLFCIGMTLLTLRILNPVDTQRLAVFGPLMLLYGAILYPTWCQRCIKRW